MFLSRWNPTSPASMRSLNDAYAGERENPSAAGLARLRDEYLKTFPDLPAEDKNRMKNAKTLSDVTSSFYASLSRGMRVRFQVKTLFKHEDDDDKEKTAAKNKSGVAAGKDKNKDKDADKDKKGDEDFFDIETPFGECGFDFQEGETYLVYATSDEDSDVLSTSGCSRTRRLSDAGEDLAYLFFYKNRPEESARLEGFATTDTLYQTRLDRMHDLETVKAPAAGIVVELQSDRMARYAESDDTGKFVFDGLLQGDYKVSAFAPGFPVETHLLAGPEPIHIVKKSCARQVLLLPKKEDN